MLRPVPPAIERLLDALSLFIMRIAGAGLVVLIVIFGWLVFGRYVLNATPTWVEQVALLLVVFISFLGAAVGVRDGNHLSVDMFVDALPPAGRKAVKTLGDAVMMVFGGAMAWYTAKLALFKWETEIPLIGLPEGLRSAPLAACGALMVLFCAVRIWRRLSTRETE